MISAGDMAFDDSMGAAMQEQSAKLLMTGLAGLDARIQFMRFAIGTQAISDDFVDFHLAKGLFDKLFAVQKSTLDWQVKTLGLSNLQMRVLMNMTFILLEPAARSGVVKVSAVEDGAEMLMEVEATGSPGILKEDVIEGVAGREPAGGWDGKSIHPYFTRLLASEIGHTLDYRKIEGGVALSSRGPRKAA
jgi:hypothetical protein